MFDYGDILSHLEEIVESIDHDEVTLTEVQKKLQYLITEIEGSWGEYHDSLGDISFDDLD
jgi:hypothetical protein